MNEEKFSLEIPWGEGANPYGNLTDKQWKILNAALVVFTEKGYSAATTSEIAKKAGVAEGTIFRHFKTKKEILLATMIPLMQNLVGPGAANSLWEMVIANDKLPIEDVLVIILEDRQKHFAKILPILKVVALEMNYHPELKDVVVNEVAIRNQDYFLRFIQQRQERGELRKDIDAWVLTRSLVGAFAFYLFSKALFPAREQGKENREQLQTIVKLFLNGAMS